MADYENIGFDTPNVDEDFARGEVDWKDGKIDSRLCAKIQNEEDCPFNMCQRACLDCDVILHPDDLRFDLNHLGITLEED